VLETPQITQTTAQPIATIHLVIPRAEMMHAFGPAVQELLAALSSQGMRPIGSAFAHHFRITPGTFDFEVGFRTEAQITAAGRVKPGVWPAEKVARTEYLGPYEGLPAAWGEFDTWMKANDLAQADDLWEDYAAGPHTSPDPANWRTVLYRPLTS
jgi:effector-binding domain-containing protein